MLEQIKQDVLINAQDAERRGLCMKGSGNFSIKDDESGFVCITPSGNSRLSLTKDDIIVVDMDANVIEAKTKLKPTSETLMHLEIYKQRKDIHAVSHVHSTVATSFAILGKPIPAIIYEIFLINCKDGNTVPVAEYGRPGSVDLAIKTAKALADSDVALMKGHGTIAVHPTSLEDAIIRSMYVEELAKMYLTTLQITGGKEPPHIPDSELKKWEYPKEIKLNF